MTIGNHDMTERLDRYLDDALSGPELAAFEAQAAAEPGLRTEIDRQRRIDASLRRSFAPVAAAVPQPAPARRSADVLVRIRWVVAAAAVIAIGTALAWPTLFPSRSGSSTPTIVGKPRLSAPDASYEEIVAQGFQPYTVCENDAQFADYTGTRFDQRLHVKNPEGIQVVGWVYEQRVLSTSTLSLLVKDGADKIVVFLDRKGEDRQLAIAPDSKLHLFRAEVGNVVMYEVTPRDSASVLPRIAAADAGH